MDAGTRDLGDLGGQLRASEQDAYVRALLVRGGQGWELYHCWALIGFEPPGWEELIWEYDQLAFVSACVPAHSLASLSSSADGAQIAIGRFVAAVPGVNGPANWTHRPSYARHERVPVPVPVTDYRIAASSPYREIRHDTLVGHGIPSFPEPNSAWRAFAEGDFSLSGAGQPPNEVALLRTAETEAWIGHVHVTATVVEADIRGDEAGGAELELYGVSDRAHKRLDGPGTVVFPVADGLPASAWLWLKRQSRWLDYRSIDAKSGWTVDLAQAGVTIEQPVEPQANIEALIASGEGPQLEFKEQLPSGPRDRMKLKTVAAFATGRGGSMVFGVNRDEMTITGLGNVDPNQARDHLVNLVRAAVIPTPEMTVSYYMIDGKLILVLDIPHGKSAPYGMVNDPSSRDRPDFYVRRGANTYPAQPSDLREAVLADIPNEKSRNRAKPFGR